MATDLETPDLDRQDAPTSRSGPGLLQIAWQRKSLVILGIMIGLVLGLLYYAQRQPVYQSQAQILVVKKTPDIGLSQAPNSQMQYMDDYMTTQQVLVRSPEIIRQAVETLNELKSFPNEGKDELIYSIIQSLTVARDLKEQGMAPTNILMLTFRGTVADECPKVLNAVITSYQNFLNNTYNEVGTTTVNLIGQARDQLSVLIDQKQKEYEKFLRELPQLLIRTQNGSANFYADAIAKIRGRQTDLKVKKSETERRLARIKKVLKEEGPEAARSYIVATGVKIALYSGSEELEKQLLIAKAEKEMLTEAFGNHHPSVVAAGKKIEVYEKLLSKGIIRGRKPVAGAPANKPDAKDGKAEVRDNRPDGRDIKPEVRSTALDLNELDSVDLYVTAMEYEIEDTSALLATLEELYDKEQKSARDWNEIEMRDQHFRRGIESAQQLLDVTVRRLQETSMTKDVGGYKARIIAPPGLLGKKVSPNPYQVFPVAGMAGFLAGLCLAYLAELSDKSFRTPAEIRRRLGLPVIGHIPFFGPDEKAAKQLAAGEPVVDPMLCTHYQSNSVSSEAYRSVRTALYFNTQGVGHQVIQVTSPNVSDGKSTLAGNLAVSIAQSGKRTIIIDADCRRPRVHKIFNIPHDTGLASVITGQCDLASAIRPSAIPNLSVLPCGPRPANPAELLTSPRFKELLDIIRAQYDFVIVDTPPLLVVTDPCVVAPRVDGVIMAIRVTKNGRPFAERAKEILGSLGANVIGVVVNGLGSQGGGKYGYGYDQYQYGYGYTYRYSYTYADEYTDDKAASYYQNVTPDTTDVPAAPNAGAESGTPGAAQSGAPVDDTP